MYRAFQRLAALIQKETTQLLRDRRTLLMLLGLPLIELLLFAYAVKLTVDHLPTALVDQSLDDQSRAFIAALENSGYFDIDRIYLDEKQITQGIDSGQVKVGIVIPPDFAAHVTRGDANVLILIDGSDSFSLQSGYNAASSIAQIYNLDLVTKKMIRSGAVNASTRQLPLVTLMRVLYNPDMDDLTFILPGLVALVIQSLAVASAATSVVREREAGTLEQLLSTPTRPLELMVGKLLPISGLVFLDMLILLGLGVYWFGVPFLGNFSVFVWLTILFIVSCLGTGLLISTVARTQKQAQQFANFLMMFSMLLTGFLYPRDPMPWIPKAIGSLIPLTYFIRIARGVITKGIGVTFLWSDTLVLAFYSMLIILLASITFRKRLD